MCEHTCESCGKTFYADEIEVQCPHCLYCSSCGGNCFWQHPVGAKIMPSRAVVAFVDPADDFALQHEVGASLFQSGGAVAAVGPADGFIRQQVVGSTLVQSSGAVVAVDPADALFEMAERLYMLPNKDVTFLLADGEEKAHGLILMAGSDVFLRMLESPLSEGATRKISLPEFNVTTMRVFLRLLYTGHANPKDWKDYDVALEMQCEASTIDAVRDTRELVPLRIMLSVAILVKKFIVVPLVDLTTQCLISRLNATLAQPALIKLWDEIMAGVIKHNLGPVRSAGLEAAKNSEIVRARFNARDLQPEVLYELRAFWALPSVRTKRPRYA